MKQDDATTSIGEQPSVQAAEPPETRPASDLAQNRPGQSAQEQADKILSQVHPFKRWLQRFFALNTEGENWRRGALGERMVGAELAKLGPEWKTLHAVPVGVRGSDIDHLLIGPGGVFTVNTKNHSRSKVWCGGRMVMVNGHKQPYVRNSTHEAARAARILTAACNHAVDVEGLLVFIAAPGKLTIKRPKEKIQVSFLHYQQLRKWAKGRPAVLSPEQVEAVYAAARISTIWTVPPKPAARPQRRPRPQARLLS